MPWIKVVHEADAEGELEEVYSGIVSARGKLSNIMRVHSLHPAAMQAHMNLYLTLMFGRSGLNRAERELLATVVSAVNGCDYCVRHHSEALLAYWKDPERVAMVARDHSSVDLPERARSMLDYAVLSTRNPSAVTEVHIQDLRDAGFSDRDILDINLITSYFNFVNRIASGLGVEFSDEEAHGYRY